MARYMLGIDQSTQGTKALLFDESGLLACRADIPHRQMVDDKGWVEHDPVEIYQNTVQAVKDVVAKAGIDKGMVAAVGISNQRETAMAWDRDSGEPAYHAIVWQCARGAAICGDLEAAGHGELIRSHTGLKLSPYFSAAKIAWVLRHVDGARERAEQGKLCCGTMDSWLVYQLTGGERFQTDHSNASRTQLFNIGRLEWDPEICGLFQIPMECLAQVTDSDGDFGSTDFDGFFERPIPIRGVLGDSHGALFGQGCLEKGMIKATYGTGSSVMMNIGEQPVFSRRVVTSLAWRMGGQAQYVLEGNINYTGAVVSWMKDGLGLISSPAQAQELAEQANPADTTYLVPAFSGLGAPYWDSEAKAVLWGMTRTTGRAELVKAGLDCIAYQIADILEAMSREAAVPIRELRVDGGPTRNAYLMQFQSDIAGIPLQVPSAEELSGMGAAYAAGLAIGFYRRESVFCSVTRKEFLPCMDRTTREAKYAGWKEAVGKAFSSTPHQS